MAFVICKFTKNKELDRIAKKCIVPSIPMLLQQALLVCTRSLSTLPEAKLKYLLGDLHNLS